MAAELCMRAVVRDVRSGWWAVLWEPRKGFSWHCGVIAPTSIFVPFLPADSRWVALMTSPWRTPHARLGERRSRWTSVCTCGPRQDRRGCRPETSCGGSRGLMWIATASTARSCTSSSGRMINLESVGLLVPFVLCLRCLAAALVSASSVICGHLRSHAVAMFPMEEWGGGRGRSLCRGRQASCSCCPSRPATLHKQRAHPLLRDRYYQVTRGSWLWLHKQCQPDSRPAAATRPPALCVGRGQDFLRQRLGSPITSKATAKLTTRTRRYANTHITTPGPQ
jgi:hypothetical protein